MAALAPTKPTAAVVPAPTPPSRMASIAARLRQLADSAEAADGGAVAPQMELAAQLSTMADSLRKAANKQIRKQNQPVIPKPEKWTDPQGPSHAAAPDDDDEQGCGLQPPAKKKQKRAPREFDFSRYKTRHVALELMYVGTSYQGLARQENTENTIEAALFNALKRTKLIPEQADFTQLKYARCGRTDKGVSALGQVVSIMLRSSALRAAPGASSKPGSEAADLQCTPGLDSSTQATAPPPPDQEDAAGKDQQQHQVAEGEEEEAGEQLPPPHLELDYPRLINRALPKDIRILGWTPVPDTFHARFSCRYRQYKYFITDRDGDLNIPAMREAAQLLVGQHDYRHFCKPDVLAVKSFERYIMSFTLEPYGVDAVLPHPPPGGHPLPGAMLKQQHEQQLRLQQQQQLVASGATSSAVVVQAAAQQEAQPVASNGLTDVCRTYAFTVTGTAFLWHQVRCMVAVLMMVGRGQEQPSIVSRLLDIKATPCKPVYQMAPEEPLLLYACGYEDLTFIRSPRLAADLSAHVREMCESHLVAASLTGAISTRLARDAESDGREPVLPDSSTTKQPKRAQHVPLLQRPVESSIEEKMRKAGISSLGQGQSGQADDR